MDERASRPAGAFSPWLGRITTAIRTDGESDVPCDGCTACCAAAQFVPIGADEIETLARIPEPLRFPAPGRSDGQVVLGYDEHGRCPMLVDDRCSIYEHRPRACRTYDCRVFAAAGFEPGDAAQARVAARVREWQFDHPTAVDRDQHAAIQAAAAFLRTHRRDLGAGLVPAADTQLAVLAVDVHDAFAGDPSPPVDAVRVAIGERIGLRPRNDSVELHGSGHG